MRALRYLSSQDLPPDLAGSWDFDTFADEREMETLRQALRQELRVHTGQRTLAREIGIDRGSLRKFLDMQTIPRPHNLDKLREWVADRPEIRTPLGAVALAVLVRDVPAKCRARFRRRIARELASTFTLEGEPVPEWLAAEYTPTR